MTLTVLKVGKPPKSRKKRGKKSSKNKSSSVGLTIHTCFKNIIRTIIFLFLIVHIIWGFAEILAALLVDFVVNHEQGMDGFTMAPQLDIIDISEYDHREWEEASTVAFHTKTDRDKTMLATREKLIKRCSKFPKKYRVAENYHANCNNATIPNFQEDNYFCAVIQQPDKFHAAYRVVVKLWFATTCLALGSAPFVIFAFVWQSKCTRLLLIYLVFQIAPISTSLTILYILWIHNKFELCGLEYMYWDIPVRTIFTFVFFIKLVVKAVEIAFTIWFIYLTHNAAEQRGTGSKLQQKYHAEDEPVTFNNEILRSSRMIEEEEKPEVDRKKKFGVHQRNPPNDKEQTDKEQHKGPKPRPSAKTASDSETDLTADQVLPDGE